MSALVCRANGRRVVLGSRCIVGRGPWVQLKLDDSTVSAEHASIYFDGTAWKVRDLGSRNGTFLNRVQLDGASARVLRTGDELCFGAPSQPPWLLESERPPGPAARDPAGTVVTGDSCTLWLPQRSGGEACVRFHANRWLLESADDCRTVADGDTVVLAGTSYILELPPATAGLDAIETTLDAGRIPDVRLTFLVSQDQEHVLLEAAVGEKHIPLGARAHNFPLLCLARRRLAERANGITESECGWLYVQDLREALGLDRVVLNLQLWRATQALNRAGLPAERLIERRPDAQQLRIGFRDLLVGPQS